ncbi:MAG TPA: DUF1524 domain-containing protein [Candidatus Merdenecus merdavium]|nr:DUF1524 domain-containing protein [Candidatus Merdenecus merdavium]
MSSAYIKGMICILTAQNPKSFEDGGNVVIDNAWLSQSNSKNYHHFFPKAYMKKNQLQIEEDLVNHIANITIVDGYLNKNVIKAKAPSAYMKDCKEKNHELEKTMKTHLIDDIDNFGIWDNDYKLFMKKRIKKIQEQLKERLIKRAYDEH